MKKKNFAAGGSIMGESAGVSSAGSSGFNIMDLFGSSEDGGSSMGGFGEILGGISGALKASTDAKNREYAERLEEGRESPMEIMAEYERNSLISGAATGALEGLESGGIFGAIAGLASGLFSTGIGNYANKEQVKEMQDEWSSYWGSRSAKNIDASGYKSGGKIKGKGTGKSDDVKMKAPEDAFIVPVENAPTAMQMGKDFFGWKDDEVASRNYGNIDINASNGEVFFTSDEYDALRYYGVDVDALAPDAEKNNTGFCRGGKTKKGYQEGGIIKQTGATDPDELFDYEHRADLLRQIGLLKANNEFESDRAKDLAAQIEGMVNFTPTKEKSDFTLDDAEAALSATLDDPRYQNNPEWVKSTAPKYVDPNTEAEKSNLDKFLDAVGLFAGAAQTAGGIAGLMKAGARPDINVSTTLKKLSREVREAAGYGLDPAAKNALKKQQARAYRDTIKSITSKGGSAQELYNQQIGALSTRLAAQEKTELADYMAKEKKVDRVVDVDLALAGQELDVSKIGLETWDKDQDVWANLLSAGIENTIGSSQYNRQLKWFEENADKGTNFTIKT